MSKYLISYTNGGVGYGMPDAFEEAGQALEARCLQVDCEANLLDRTTLKVLGYCRRVAAGHFVFTKART